jgi:hypothetical protein
MSDAEHDLTNAGALQQVELMIDERAAGNIDQRLGNRAGDRAKARGQAASKERDGNAGDI